MSKVKKTNIIALIILVIPLVLAYQLFDQSKVLYFNGDVHFYYVIFSSFIALSVCFVALMEYKKNKEPKIFLISLGFLGVAIIYGFHAFITPNISFYKYFTFPDIQTNINVFIFCFMNIKPFF